MRNDPTLKRDISTFPNDNKNYSIGMLPIFMLQFAEFPYKDLKYDDEFKSHLKI